MNARAVVLAWGVGVAVVGKCADAVGVGIRGGHLDL